VLTFFGLIHSEAIGVMKTPSVAASYLVVALFLFVCSKKASMAEEPMAEADSEGAEPQLA